jgi:hypothetical protein
MSGRRAASALDRRRRAQPKRAARLLDQADASLLDLIDNVLNRGVVIEGDVVIGLADVDLIHLRLSVLLAAVQRREERGR